MARIAALVRGAVAQLGERRVRNAKVEGSIPFRSTIFLPPTRTKFVPVAQRIEHSPPKRGVAGSIPAGDAIPSLPAPSSGGSHVTMAGGYDRD